MRFAINPITTWHYDFLTNIDAYHRAGVTHMELWFDNLDQYLQQSKQTLDGVLDLLKARNLSLVGALCVSQITLHDLGQSGEFLDEFQTRLSTCSALGCPMLLTIPHTPSPGENMPYSTVELRLRKAADIAADHGITIGLEFLNGNGLIGSLTTAKQVVRGAARPNLGVVLDLSHFWMGRCDLTDLHDMTAGELALVHLADMSDIPPERMTDHDRTFPSQGRAIDRLLVPAILATGYDGFWSLELFNKQIWQRPIDQIVAASMTSFAYIQRTYSSSNGATKRERVIPKTFRKILHPW